jgi:hypothetical protein
LASRREFFALSLAPFVTAAAPRTSLLTLDQVAPLARCISVPPAWPQWLQRHDQAIRSRLRRGDEDSLVNFVLYGVSFTSQPRDVAFSARIRDFKQALAHPGNNERLVWLKQVLTRQNSSVEQLISRYQAEQQHYRTLLDKAPVNDAALPQLYKDRGLSIDTNFRPNWAIEKTLAQLKQRGALTSVRRAAIIGPGLDFTDKDHGFDYYPLQTLQPFALADSLLRLGLSTPADLKISLFDISSQTLDHVSRARAAGPYTVQLVLDETRAAWNPDTLAYWQRFGDQIGTPTQALSAPPQVQHVRRKAVRVRPEIVRLLEPLPLNIVTERPDLPANQTWDLLLATNVLVYYDAFDRTLASLNIQAMLSPGGIFLSNSSLPECPAINLHPTGNVDVQYSSETGDDDRIEIYSNARFGRNLAPQ